MAKRITWAYSIGWSQSWGYGERWEGATGRTSGSTGGGRGGKLKKGEEARLAEQHAAGYVGQLARAQEVVDGHAAGSSLHGFRDEVEGRENLQRLGMRYASDHYGVVAPIMRPSKAEAIAAGLDLL